VSVVVAFVEVVVVPTVGLAVVTVEDTVVLWA